VYRSVSRFPRLLFPFSAVLVIFGSGTLFAKTLIEPECVFPTSFPSLERKSRFIDKEV